MREHEIIQEFWRLMATNDFASVGALLGPDFVLEWPQSGERIRTLDQGKVARLVEYWPEPYDPPANRAHLVERWQP